MSADAAEIARLERRHRDIALHGAGVIALTQAKTDRQLRMQAFAENHGLKCFKCGSDFNDWAKTGITNKRPWGICQVCIRKKRAK